MEKLISYYASFVYEQRKLIGYGLSRNTHKTYLSRAKNLRDFLKSIRCQDMRPCDVDIRMIRSFDIYLRSNKKHCNDYVMRNIQMLKRMLSLAIDDGLINSNPADRYKFKYQRNKRRVFLDLNQLATLKSCNLSPDLERNRDMFLFCCYTGMSYCDVKNFTKKNVVNKLGKDWIKIVRQKTKWNNDTFLPMLSGASAILEKYGYDLPISSCSKMNQALKKISKIAKLDLPLGTHAGRKTFGNILVNDFGVDIKTVSTMMGHRSVVTTEQWYVDVREKKITRDMREAMAVNW